MRDGSFRHLDCVVRLLAKSDQSSDICVLAKRNQDGVPGYIELTPEQALELKTFLDTHLPARDIDSNPAAACALLPAIIRAMLDFRCDPRPQPDHSMFSVQSWLCECLSLCSNPNAEVQRRGCAMIVDAKRKLNADEEGS